MELLLTIALILVNLAWLFFLDRRDKRDRAERTELHNRMAEPEMVVPPEEIVRAKIDSIKSTQKKASKPDPLDMTIPERHEFAAVGRVDPELMRKDGDG